MGTPNSLKQALMNGLVEAVSKKQLNPEQTARLAKMSPEAIKLWALEVQENQIATIEAHVLDFFRQKFGVAYLQLSEWAENHSQGKDPGEIIRLLAVSTGVSRK